MWDLHLRTTHSYFPKLKAWSRGALHRCEKYLNSCFRIDWDRVKRIQDRDDSQSSWRSQTLNLQGQFRGQWTRLGGPESRRIARQDIWPILERQSSRWSLWSGRASWSIVQKLSQFRTKWHLICVDRCQSGSYLCLKWSDKKSLPLWIIACLLEKRVLPRSNSYIWHYRIQFNDLLQQTTSSDFYLRWEVYRI